MHFWTNEREEAGSNENSFLMNTPNRANENEIEEIWAIEGNAAASDMARSSARTDRARVRNDEEQVGKAHSQALSMNMTLANLKHLAWRIGRIVITVAIVLAISYSISFSPVAIDSYTISRGPIAAEVMGTGTLEARVEATISPKISGRIEKVHIDQGDRVKAGDLLVRLDAEELQQQVAIAQANLDAAVAETERLKAEKVRETAIYEQARTSNERSMKLLSQRAVSREEVDKTHEALAIASAGVSRSDAAITEGQKVLLAAEKTLDYHRARLKDTEIVAPFGGLIIKRHREAGDVVVPGSSVLTLVSTEELWVSVWIDETEMAKIRTDQKARIVFRSEPGKTYPGKVARLGKEADRETREFLVDSVVIELPENWAIGQRAEAFVEVADKADAIVVPAPYLSIRNGETGVFVRNGSLAVWRPVRTGLRNRDSVEVVEGVSPGEIVIKPADASTILSEGKRVRSR